MSKLKLEITNFVRKLPLSEKKIQSIAQAVWQGQRAGHAEISIAIVGDQRMYKLTEQYVGRRYRTDVLAFELSDKSDKEFLGQVVINSQLARYMATKSDVTASAELALYLIHGLLHLSGYDDKTKKQSQNIGIVYIC